MQFDVYKNENPTSKKRFPYLLDVQVELLDSLETRVVIPLTDRQSSEEMIVTRLMPVFAISGKEYLALTPQLAGIPKRHLGDYVGNLSESRTEIIAALDLLFTGV